MIATLYDCASQKSEGCAKKAAAIYSDGCFGYPGTVERRGFRLVAICWPCFQWEHANELLAKMKGDEASRFVIAGGVIHHIGIHKKPHKFNGFGGQWWTIRFTDGRVVETCDLWHSGDVLPEFAESMPDNATITKGRIQEVAS